MRRSRGFSLIELMLVVAILGMLKTAVAVSVGGVSLDARRSKVAADFSTFKQAIGMYRLKTGKLPQRLDDLVAKHLEKVPSDPWNHDYVYTTAPTSSGYLVTSYGADGVPGGNEDNTDLTTENIDKFVGGGG